MAAALLTLHIQKIVEDGAVGLHGIFIPGLEVDIISGQLHSRQLVGGGRGKTRKDESQLLLYGAAITKIFLKFPSVFTDVLLQLLALGVFLLQPGPHIGIFVGLPFFRRHSGGDGVSFLITLAHGLAVLIPALLAVAGQLTVDFGDTGHRNQLTGQHGPGARDDQHQSNPSYQQKQKCDGGAASACGNQQTECQKKGEKKQGKSDQQEDPEPMIRGQRDAVKQHQQQCQQNWNQQRDDHAQPGTD